MQGPTAYNVAFVISNGAQEPGYFPGIDNGRHALGVGKPNGPTQVTCRNTLSPACGPGTTKDPALVLVRPVGCFHNSFGFNSLQRAKQLSCGYLLYRGGPWPGNNVPNSVDVYRYP